MNSNEYLYYYLKYIRKKIINYDRGSSQPSIKKTDLLNTMIRIPNKKNQNAITNLLLSMEYKIELNNNIISNLEELAQTLFKRWLDRKSTRLNSSHVSISYAVFCLKNKKI